MAPHAAAGADASSAGSSELSWKVVSYMYAVGSLACAIFGGLHAWPSVDADGAAAKAFPQVQGYYLIFSPFPPCFAYALHRWRAQSAARLLAKKAD